MSSALRSTTDRRSPSDTAHRAVGASAVLVFAVPASPLAQPWSIMAGNLVGPASYVRERIAAFKESGVTNLSVSPAAPDSAAAAATIAQIKEWVA